MADLIRYAAQLEDAASGSLPPVDKWNPEISGEIDLVIKRDGTWMHEGAPIKRAPLVRLFSTVLKREGQKYFLVTPVEKLEIRVEDAPFVAVLMKQDSQGPDQNLTFTTNVGDTIGAGRDHRLEFRTDMNTGESAPYLHVRMGLDARIARAVFYDLVDLCETRTIGGEKHFGVYSGGEFFFTRTGG
ncbi:DUF1285 domain-containing protein [Hyphococcus sp.]|uniref:DUF1285 domain-containing protein n=1 Tax=Hyphococcus sp. TaxID=2038636 RepID=UPI003CCBEB21